MCKCVSALFCAASIAISCAHHKDTFVWAKDLPPTQQTPQPYRVRNTDILNILVWGQPDISREVRVRSDGKISLPLMGDSQVAGMTPAEIATNVETSLQGFLVDPQVTVIVAEPRPPMISVLGAVRSPGTYPANKDDNILHIIAKAGGLTPSAQMDKLFVLRQTPKPLRIRFDYQAMQTGEALPQHFALQDGDILIVDD